MSATQAPPTNTERLREILDLLDEADGVPGGFRDVVAHLTGKPDLYAGFERAYLLGTLRGVARQALREWEGRS